jgi:putative flippase GtrA
MRPNSMKLLLSRIVSAAYLNPIALKMISFASIGLANTGVDLAAFTFAYRILELPLVPSNVVAWLVAVSGSYVMNTMITFRAESGRVLRQRDYLSFAASGILGVIATTTTLVILSNYVPVFTAKLISILVGFAVNFTMSHFVVFRPTGPSDIA